MVPPCYRRVGVKAPRKWSGSQVEAVKACISLDTGSCGEEADGWMGNGVARDAGKERREE